MTIKYFANNLNLILKKKSKNSILDVYVSQRQKHVHIVFGRLLLAIKNSPEILELILDDWDRYSGHATSCSKINT